MLHASERDARRLKDAGAISNCTFLRKLVDICAYCVKELNLCARATVMIEVHMRAAITMIFFFFGIPAVAAPPLTAFYYTGSPLSFITQGKTATLTPADGYTFIANVATHFAADTSPDVAWIGATNFSVDQDWIVYLAVPKGQARGGDVFERNSIWG
jgi:hypothetical protein